MVGGVLDGIGAWPSRGVQGHLAHKKQRPPRNLQKDYLGSHGCRRGIGVSLMGEVPLCLAHNVLLKLVLHIRNDTSTTRNRRPLLQGYLAHNKPPPRRTLQ